MLRGVSLCRFGLFGLSRHLCHYFVTLVGNFATARAFAS
jgi:hypothetical protein